MNSFDFEKISIIGSKIGIVLIFIFIIMGIFYLFCIKKRWGTDKVKDSTNIKEETPPEYIDIIPGTINNDNKNHVNVLVPPVPPPPSLPFFGRSRSETISINVFAHLVHKKGYNWKDIIIGHRPEILKNPKTGRCLEIDAYHPHLKIGIEYNGIQHYKFPNHIHFDTPIGKKAFDDGIERDILKKSLCKDNNIHLIDIPYWIDTCVKGSDVNGEAQWVYKKSTDQEKWDSIHSFLENKMNRNNHL